MGMSGWIMDVEEAYWDQVARIVEDSEHISEAEDRALATTNGMFDSDDPFNLFEKETLH